MILIFHSINVTNPIYWFALICTILTILEINPTWSLCTILLMLNFICLYFVHITWICVHQAVSPELDGAPGWTLCSILAAVCNHGVCWLIAWRIPGMDEPGGLQSMGSQRVGHDWVTSLSRIGEGNGNPLRCSCLENPRDGGAWWAAVYGVAQSRTWLKRTPGCEDQLQAPV